MTERYAPAPEFAIDRSSLLAQVLDAVPSAIAFWDRDLRNVFANRTAYLEWFGTSPDDLYGLHSRELLGEEMYALNEPYMRRCLDGERQVFERNLVTPLGGRRLAQIEYTPFRRDGAVVGLITVIVDISARVAAERTARETAETLATMTERRRIEDRAHDVILQDLFAARLDVDRARKEVSDASQAAVSLDSATSWLDSAVSDLRATVAGRSGGAAGVSTA